MSRISASEKETVRARLLETAARHFARDGLDGANVDAISLDAGFAKGTLYNYFRSKEELFAEVLAEGCRRAVQRYAAARPRGSVRERLMALAAADVAILREDEGFQKVLVREVMSFRKETYSLIVVHLAPYVEKVEEILAEGIAAGEVRNDRPLRELALLFVGILALLYVQYWGSEGSWPDLEEIPELAVMTFLDGAAQGARPAGAR